MQKLFRLNLEVALSGAFALILLFAVLLAAAPEARAKSIADGFSAAVRQGTLVLVQPGGQSVRIPLKRISFTDSEQRIQATGVTGIKRSAKGLTIGLKTGGDGSATLKAASGDQGSMILSAQRNGGTATSASISFDSARGEKFFGFGERSDSVAQRGTSVENYVSDGPFSEGSKNLVKATIPPAGFRDRSDSTYYPVPWMLSSKGYGVLIRNDQTSYWDLPKAAGDYVARVEAPRISLQVFPGPTPARALTRFTAATGRQPKPAAAWAFGPWLQTGQPNAPEMDEQIADLRKLQAADAPVSAAETQLRYLPCGLDRGYEDYERDRVSFYHRNGLTVLTYVNPMVCEIYEPFFSQVRDAGGLLAKASDPDQPALFNSFVGGVGAAGFSIQPVGEFDFTNKAGVDSYRSIVDKMLKSKHDGWMEDFGEYTPLDAKSANGPAGSALHNAYPKLYHCAVHQMVKNRPVVRFQRSGWTGAAKCADDVWGGDPTTEWGFDGLSSAITQALSIGLSGVSRWGSDIGGYDTIGDDKPLTPELLKRWIQFGAVSGVMRIKKSGLAIPAYTRPQVWDPEIIDTWRRYTKLHTQLYPYILAADAHYRKPGIPRMRSLLLLHPGDRRAVAAEDEFMFGPSLLAAPVVAEGANRRSLYLPKGDWINAAKGLAYAKGSGAFGADKAKAVKGGRRVTVAARLERLPLFIKANSVIPMLPADVDSLSDYGGKQVVNLKDRSHRIRLLAFPSRGTAKTTMMNGEKLSSKAKRGRWQLRIKGSRSRSYSIEASTSNLKGSHGGSFRVCKVELGKKTLPKKKWRQAGAGAVLRFTFKAKKATVTVTACR